MSTSAATEDEDVKAAAAPAAAAKEAADEKEASKSDDKGDAEAEEVDDEDSDDAGDKKPAKKKQKMYKPLASSQQKKLNFAQRLMELLEKEDVKPILHWMDDGESICFEDTVRFAEEVMPKYFSDTKYKSFMVRMKRWGFKHVTPSKHDNVSESAKIMQCELFLRDQPELCLLMGDERRVDRIKVAKMIHKAATEKKEKKAAEDAAASTVARAARSSTISDSEMAMLSYQRNLANLQTYNLLATQGRQLGLSGMSSSPRGVLGNSVSLPFSRSYIGDAAQGERAIAAMPMVQIERDIQSCLETIAAQEDRLSVLMTMKEVKLRMEMRRNSGMSSGGGYMGSMSMDR